MSQAPTLPHLPFTKPTIDEATVSAVADVLRSGWLTSNGPKVQAFEAQLSEYFGGRPVRTYNSGTCTMEIALRIAGIGPGDEVITTPNSWVATANVIIEVGATPVFADIDPRTHNIDLDKVEAAITPRTKAIFFATPCNPTGVVMPRADLERIAQLAREHDLWVLSDEVYADLTFEREHVSIASLDGMAERTVTIASLSKSHAMAGWRVGWVIGPEALIGHLGRLALCMLYGLPGFIQEAALTAFEQKAQIVAEMREVYQRRRDIVYERLSRVPGLRCLLPEAGMFMMVDVSGCGLDTVDFTWQLFRAQGVSLLDASAFGETANGFVRLGFVVEESRLAEACDRIAAFVGSLRVKQGLMAS